MDNINKYIDHTLLKPNASAAEVLRLCDEAKRYDFKSVCINPCRVRLAAQALEGSGVLTCCVIGFPLGASATITKAFEAAAAVKDGANELDMVINIGAAMDGDWTLVERDIRAVVEATGGSAAVKVIIETCLLTDEQKIKACECAMRAGADFVKTSTGFSSAGATADDVALMRSVVGNSMGVKASGGIRTAEDARIMLEAGASRLGTSNGINLLK